jgi:hypothetical protein
MHLLSPLYSICRLLHVSASLCHLQGDSYVLMSYLKAELVMLFVMYCECWWPVCTGCCSFVCYVVQLSAERSAAQHKIHKIILPPRRICWLFYNDTTKCSVQLSRYPTNVQRGPVRLTRLCLNVFEYTKLSRVSTMWAYVVTVIELRAKNNREYPRKATVNNYSALRLVT